MKIAQYIKRLVIIISFFGLTVFLTQALVSAKNLNPEVAQLIREVPSKEEYSNAGAVILLRERVMVVEKGGLWNRTLHTVGKILDSKAASDYGQIPISFNSYYEEATLDFAHTIRKDGKVLEVSKDAIQLKTPPEAGVKSYTDIQVLTFSLPSLEPGSIFEYQIKLRQKKPMIENKWNIYFRFNCVLYPLTPPYIPRIDPVFKSRLILKVQDGEKFIYDVEKTKVSPIIEKEGDLITYTWEVKDLPAIPIEDYMPVIDDIIPGIKLSSLEGWEEVNAWASKIIFSKIDVTEEIKAKAQEIIRDAKTEKEKIDALFYFIQSDIKYIQADLDRGGYMPHSANEILKNKYGDCKDQVVLFLSLLKAIGITAYPALINTLVDVNRKVSSPHAFNHLIVYVPFEEGNLWLDTTSDATEFPFLHWANQDRWAFIINGKGGKFLRTPSLKPEHNQGNININYNFENESPHYKMTIGGKGAMGDSLKSILKPLSSDQQKEGFRKLIKSMSPNKIMVQTIEISDLQNPRSPLKITISVEMIIPFEIKDLWKKKMMETFSFNDDALQAVSLFTELHNLPTPENRKNDLMLIKLKLVNESICPPPDKNFKPDTLPNDQSLDTKLISFHTKYTKEGDAVKARFGFTLKQNIITKNEYKEFYETVQDVLEKSKWKVVFKKQKIDEKEKALEETMEKHPQDAAAFLNLAKHYLTKGKYRDGKELLEKAVAMDLKNGEIHYFLGIALGYLDQYDEAKREFEKAKELGYKP